MTPTRTLLALATLALQPLSAQDVRFGLQAQVGIPTGDLKTAVDSKAGLGLGIHATWELQPQVQLRGRVDYMQFPNVTVSSVTNKLSNLSFGADALYFTQGKVGPYLSGGLSLNRWEVEQGGFNASTTRLGLAAGGGYAVNQKVSFEARYQVSSLASGFDANLVLVTALYRF